MDCQDSDQHWQSTWSLPKIAWCCGKWNKECPGLFDCSSKFLNSDSHWVHFKEDWCCREENQCGLLHIPFDDWTWWCNLGKCARMNETSVDWAFMCSVCDDTHSVRVKKAPRQKTVMGLLRPARGVV
eukprot:TRINITY_DN6776_c0_g1_i5.p3 TRINITY_DN6776_c0_g1~~TRINITY_DN6776_c0_g1_i5.p3  ORF type:complete len:127 (-),score=39.45 TRINITY_DN6776_c0_g1_i5:136-516(-)